tara:strand:- start:925 stop:1593 length:669 start_codon:yes stop_codon:yes gene_type:complete
MTIDEIYKFVQFMANKEQRGFIKPSEFNMLAKRAQLDVLKERVGKASPSGSIIGYKDSAQLSDELYPVTVFEASLTVSGDLFTFPADYLHFISLKYGNNSVEMVSLGELNSRRESSLVDPSGRYPVGVIEASGIRVYTDTIGESNTNNDAKLTYIKKPSDPNWAYTIVNNIEIYNSSDSTQITLSDSTHKEIANRILGYVGINLREAEIIQLSTASNVEQKS